MKMGISDNTCAAISPIRAAYGNLNVVYHGKVPAYSLIYFYYTRIRLFMDEKLF
jgi:hypothetical protein